MVFRKALHIILLVVFLLTSVTGWAADDCCPQTGTSSEISCDASDNCTSATLSLELPKKTSDSDSTDRQMFCTCVTCHVLFLQALTADFQMPDLSERISLISVAVPLSTDLSDIFRPPLA